MLSVWTFISCKLFCCCDSRFLSPVSWPLIVVNIVGILDLSFNSFIYKCKKKKEILKENIYKFQYIMDLVDICCTFQTFKKLKQHLYQQIYLLEFWNYWTTTTCEENHLSYPHKIHQKENIKATVEITFLARKRFTFDDIMFHKPTIIIHHLSLCIYTFMSNVYACCEALLTTAIS